MTLSFLDRGRVPTAQIAAPAGADMGNQFSVIPGGNFAYDTVGDAYLSLQGRASLTLLAVLIAGAVVFYMWTRDAQGS